MFFHHRYRSPYVRRKKRRVFFTSCALVFFSFVVIAGWFSWLAHRPAVTVSHILVSGNSSLTATELTAHTREIISGKYFFLFPRSNSFLLPRAGIRETLLNTFPSLKSITISLENIKTLMVEVREREARYFWCGEGLMEYATTSEGALEPKKEPCYLVDDTGVIFAEAAEFSDTFFFEFHHPIRGEKVRAGSIRKSPLGHRALPEEEFKNVVGLKETLEAAGFRAEQFVIDSEGAYAFAFEGGGRVFFDRAKEGGTLLSDLSSVLSSGIFGDDAAELGSHIEYIDLRFGNKVFYKLK